MTKNPPISEIAYPTEILSGRLSLSRNGKDGEVALCSLCFSINSRIRNPFSRRLVRRRADERTVSWTEQKDVSRMQIDARRNKKGNVGHKVTSSYLYTYIGGSVYRASQSRGAEME